MMAEFVWKKEGIFNKALYCFGWLGVLNLLFWIVIIIVGNLNYDKKFWNPKTYFVVYVFGWIYLIALIILVLVSMFNL